MLLQSVSSLRPSALRSSLMTLLPLTEPQGPWNHPPLSIHQIKQTINKNHPLWITCMRTQAELCALTPRYLYMEISLKHLQCEKHTPIDIVQCGGKTNCCIILSFLTTLINFDWTGHQVEPHASLIYPDQKGNFCSTTVFFFCLVVLGFFFPKKWSNLFCMLICSKKKGP